MYTNNSTNEGSALPPCATMSEREINFLLFHGIQVKVDRADWLFVRDDNHTADWLPRHLTGTIKLENPSAHYRMTQNKALETASRLLANSIRVYAGQSHKVSQTIERTLQRLDEFEAYHSVEDESRRHKVVFETTEASFNETTQLGKAAVQALVEWREKNPTISALRLTVATLSAVKHLKMSHYVLFWSHVCRKSLVLVQEDNECDHKLLHALMESQHLSTNAHLHSYERELVAAVCFSLLLAASDEATVQATNTSALSACFAMTSELGQNVTSDRLERHCRKGCHCLRARLAQPSDIMPVPSGLQSTSSCNAEEGLAMSPHTIGDT